MPMKRTVKLIGYITLVPIVLIFIIAALLYLPPFQNWAVRQVAQYASEKTAMEISVDRVRLAFPLDLSVSGVKALRQNDSLPQLKDTIADIKSTVVDISFLPLFCGRVDVNELDIRSVKFNTTNFIASARVNGFAETIQLVSHGIDLSKSDVMLDRALIDGARVQVQLSDTAKEDTATSENLWKIHLKKLELNNSSVDLSMPGDTLHIGVGIDKGVVNDGNFDLHKGIYEVGKMNASFNRITYNNRFEPWLKGLDYNHLSLSDVRIGLDSMKYSSPELFVKIGHASMKEKSGLTLSGMSGVVKMDSTTLIIPYMTADTPASHVSMSMKMDMNAFEDLNPGVFAVKAKGELGKSDILLFVPDIPQGLKSSLPRYPLAFDADVDGNLKKLNVNSVFIELPTAFKAKARGTVYNATDIERLLSSLDIDIITYNLNFLKASFLTPDMRKMINIPSGIRLSGRINSDGPLYIADVKASQGGGWMTLKGKCNTQTMTYNARIVAHGLPLQRFMPGMGLTPLTAAIDVDGAGTDIFSKSMRLKANARIEHFKYQDFDLSGTTAYANISNGVINSNINCVNSLLKGDIAFNALMSKKDLKATVTCDIDKADFYGMRLTDAPLTTSLCAHVDVASNLDDFYKAEGFVSDVVIRDSASIFRTEELYLDALTKRDTTWAKVNSGDFRLDMSASGGYESLMHLSENLSNELTKQIERKFISQDSLKQLLPIGHITLYSGKDNFVCGYAQRMGYMYREIRADITSSPESGLNGYAQADSLIINDMQLDKVRVELDTDSTGFKYKGQVKNEKTNPQYAFNALFDGRLFETGGNVNFALYDENNKLGLKMGMRALLEQNGIRVRLSDNNVVLGYRNFNANDDNYIYLADNKRLSAKMQLKADDGTGLQLFTNDENLDALQDLTLGVHHLDLSQITSILPYFPNVRGIMNGDFHVVQTEKETSVSSSLGVNGLYYEGSSMGDLSSEFVYMPLEDGGHYVDGMLIHNGNDIGTIKGTYKTESGQGILDADVDLSTLPLSLMNGFVPDQLIGLKGYGDGTLRIKGPLSAMQIDGEIDLDSAYLVSIPYGVELRIDNRPVYIKGSKLLLDNFNMYSHNEQPLVINGNVDFTDVSNMTVNMRMNARNFLLIDSKENRRSEAFGKMYVNFNANMTGPVAAMNIRGRLDVLGSTDMTYILRDTPLTTDNKMEELVKFTDFQAKQEESIVRPPIEGLYMDLAISVDQGARVFCALNATKSNYLDMVGGGDLRMIYSLDELRLTGRYTVSSGEMKYSLPIIPLKTFTITEGSYVEFTGEVMNPTLNITATEATKSSVSTDGTTRTVLFNCGVVITQTLNNMGLEFIISAPEDMTINSELQAMSKEERGKLAVTMLTTGMYLSDNNLSAFSMNDALSSFLQSEINNISGNALRTLDLSIGLDNSTDAAGTLHTDYTFKFAKRFWNNRVRIVVGGKVSSSQASAENLFDNVAFEYRLDQSANTNLRLFYDRATYDFLEGYVGQYGVGLIWKRKLQSLSEIFRFRKPLPSDQHDGEGVKSDTVNVTKPKDE